MRLQEGRGGAVWGRSWELGPGCCPQWWSRAGPGLGLQLQVGGLEGEKGDNLKQRPGLAAAEASEAGVPVEGAPALLDPQT